MRFLVVLRPNITVGFSVEDAVSAEHAISTVALEWQAKTGMRLPEGLLTVVDDSGRAQQFQTDGPLTGNNLQQLVTYLSLGPQQPTIH